MSRFKIINLIDKIFIIFSVFLILYAWINFYIRNLWITLVFSLILTSGICGAFFYFYEKKQNKLSLSKTKQNEINKNFLNFKMLSSTKKLALIKDILSIDYDVNTKNGLLQYSDQDKKCVVVIFTQRSLLTKDDFFNIIAEFTDFKFDKINIICEQCDNVSINILKNTEIKIINKERLYEEYFTRYEIYPDGNLINTESNKLDVKTILKGFIKPHKAKSYFTCGLILIFSSLILPYHIYYCFVGTILLVLAILCKIIKTNA